MGSLVHSFGTYIRKDPETGWTSSLGRNVNKIGRIMNNDETNGKSGHLVFVSVAGCLCMLASLGLMGYRISEGFSNYDSSLRERYEALSWGYIAAIIAGGGSFVFSVMEEEMRGEKILHAGAMMFAISIIIVGLICSIVLVTKDFETKEDTNYILSFLSLVSFAVGVGIFMSVLHRLGMRVLMNNLPVTENEVIQGMERRENQKNKFLRKKKGVINSIIRKKSQDSQRELV